MSFDEYYETVTDFEADYSTLQDAWKAGAAAMVERLFNMSGFSEDYKKKLIDEEVESLTEGK